MQCYQALAEAGATIAVGTWPPVLGIFKTALETGKFDQDMVLSDGSKFKIEKIYPLDAVFDNPEDVPESVKTNKRYAGLAGYTISEVRNLQCSNYKGNSSYLRTVVPPSIFQVAEAVKKDFGKIDILVHSLANGPEVTKPLLETTRNVRIIIDIACLPFLQAVGTSI